MRITRSTALFFDASVLVAGSHSPEGGSALLLDACRLGAFTAHVTSLVILEALHALERDFPARSLARFHEYLVGVSWKLLSVPSEEKLQEYAALIHPDDLHVLASAVEGQSEFLLTLDRKHILAAAKAVQEANIPIYILTPGDFIRKYYPLHEDYPPGSPRSR